MKLNELFIGTDAVSPVIGVILMVAITVILARVIDTFVLGLGDQVQSTPPNAQFTFDEQGNENVTITHDGGGPVEADNVNVTITTGTTTDCNSQEGDADGWPNTEITAGDQCEVDVGTGDGELRVVWQSDDGSNSGTLAKYDCDF